MHRFDTFLVSPTGTVVTALAILTVAAVLSALADSLFFAFLGRIAVRRGDGVLAAIAGRVRGPSRLIFPILAIEAALPAVALPDALKDNAEAVLGSCVVAAVAWALIAAIGVAGDIAKHRYRLDDADNLRARQVETRLDILSRTLITLVTIVAVAAILMTFPPIRALGATLLASAGLVGLAAGLAARPFLENLVAGVQIALTQPIRIDDVVIVETEYGRIEKITATYVVVRLWDLRRMVLPLTYFIDHPFQNWTYSAAHLLGTVFLYFDYGVAVDAIRDELPRILARTPLWDSSVVNVALTDAKDNVVEVRLLVSARSSSDLFDLRCYVREAVIAFVRDRHPSALPSTRVLVEPARAQTPAGAPATLYDNAVR